MRWTQQLERLKEFWLSNGVQPIPGVPETELYAFEEKYGVTLPQDIREYFQYINGMSPDSIDENLIRFWKLDEVKSVLEGAPDYAHSDYIAGPDKTFLFADYSLWSYAYSIQILPEHNTLGCIYIIGNKRPILLAESFSEFITLYIDNKIVIV